MKYSWLLIFSAQIQKIYHLHSDHFQFFFHPKQFNVHVVEIHDMKVEVFWEGHKIFKKEPFFYFTK